MRTEDGKMHNMTLIGEDEGTEEWYCPTCGRRLLMNWQAKFEKTVLEIGDEYAIHSGGKGDLQMGPMKVMAVDDIGPQDEPEIPIEDAWLAPWVKWLDEVGFESLWNGDV